MHCRDTWWLGTAGILGGWPLLSASVGRGQHLLLKSNNPTARVGNKQHTFMKAFGTSPRGGLDRDGAVYHPVGFRVQIVTRQCAIVSNDNSSSCYNSIHATRIRKLVNV